jgi:predicted Zn-dependent protease
VKRRRFLASGCACLAGFLPALARAQAEWQMPSRFLRPDTATDEGGLWAMMDREEARLRRSPFALRDPKLQEHIQQIACKLAGEHCPDVRVYLVRTPLFNASMAPNGMLQVWSGLMLRVENEAQLAAVLGHEIGHYAARHSLERLRDVKTRAGFAQFLGMFGAVGAIGQLGVVASMYSYSRDHEREADSIGAALMRKAGYDVAEAAKVWSNLALEVKARPNGDPSRTPLFATHPAIEERQQALVALAEAAPGGATNAEAWQQAVRPFLRDWLNEEVRRGQHDESIALLTRMIANVRAQPEYLYARGEVVRLRAKDGDFDAALADYTAAIALGGEPPETHRGLGMIQRARNKLPEAKTSLQRYIELAPDAADSAMIKSYLEEIRT